MKKVLLAAMCAVVLAGCTKQPIASFTTDKTSYTSGETIILTNTSTDADHYRWTSPDGQIFESTHLNFFTNTTDASENMLFTLEAFSKNGKKTSMATQYVTLNEVAPKFIVWMDYSGTCPDIYVDGVFAGTITKYYTSLPYFNADGCVCGTLSVGTHEIKAKIGTFSSKTTTVVANRGVVYNWQLSDN